MLTERCHALKFIQNALTQCVKGRGQFISVSGGLASGKSTVLQRLGDQAADTGIISLVATGSRAESTVRLGVVSQLFHSAGLPAPVRERAAELLNRVGQGRYAADAPTGEPRAQPSAAGMADEQAAAGLCDLLRQLSLEQPVVITVDDVQFADPASLQTLLRLRRRISSARILLAFAEWSRPRMLVSPVLAEYTRQPHLRIPLGQLSVQGTEELLTAELGAAEAKTLAAPYHDLSCGNPLLLRALTEDFRTRTAAGPTTDADVSADRGGANGAGGGMAYRRAVLDCLHRWDTGLSKVAQGLAVLGDLATRKLTSDLLRLKPEVTGELLDVLELTGLTRGGRLRHREITATVLESLPPEERARLHARAAGLLYETGAETIEIARHIVSADTLPGSWALRILRQAASKVIGRDDVELAVRGLELALRDCDEQDRLIFRTALVDIAWQVNPAAAVRHLPSLQEAMADGQLPTRDLLSVIRHRLWQGDTHAVAEPLQILLSTAGAGDTRVVSQLSLCYELIYGTAHQDLGSAVWPIEHHGLSGSRPLERGPSGRAASPAANHELLQNAERILQSQINDTVPEAATLAMLVLDQCEQSERALHWCESLLGEANRQGAVTWQAMLGSVRAALALRRGDMTTAQRHAEVALDLLHRQSWGVLIGFPLSSLVLAHTATGNHEKAGELLETTVPEAMYDTVFGLRLLHASGHYHLAVGRPFAAIDDFERCGGLMRERGLDAPLLAPWRTDLAQAHLQLGNRKKARAIALEQLEYPCAGSGASDTRSRGIALRLIAATSPLTERMPLLLEAIEALDRCGDRLEQARALADLARTHQDLGELTHARRTARRADQEAKACGAEALLPLQTRRPPAHATPALPAQRRPSNEAAASESGPTLSDAERKVATLAAYGHSNREIGQKLYITVSTVEQHLTRAYRKLNVNRRTDLPTILTHHPESA